MNDAIATAIFWTVLVLLLAVIVWSSIKNSRQRSGSKAAAPDWTRPEDYKDHHRVVWDEDPATFAPREIHWPLGVAALMGICSGQAWDKIMLSDADAARAGIQEAWGLRSRGQLLVQLHWLLREGHRTTFTQEIAAWSRLDDDAAAELQARLRTDRDPEAMEELWRLGQVRANAHDIGSVTFDAWDLARAAMLARAGFSAGWLSEQESVDTLNLISADLQRRYSGWAELGEQFSTARWYWQAQSGHEERQEAAHDASRQQALLDPKTGPWARLPWRHPIPPSRLLLADALVDEELITDAPHDPPTELGAILDEAITRRLRQRA